MAFKNDIKLVHTRDFVLYCTNPDEHLLNEWGGFTICCEIHLVENACMNT